LLGAISIPITVPAARPANTPTNVFPDVIILKFILLLSLSAKVFSSVSSSRMENTTGKIQLNLSAQERLTTLEMLFQ